MMAITIGSANKRRDTFSGDLKECETGSSALKRSWMVPSSWLILSLVLAFREHIN